MTRQHLHSNVAAQNSSEHPAWQTVFENTPGRIMLPQRAERAAVDMLGCLQGHLQQHVALVFREWQAHSDVAGTASSHVASESSERDLERERTRLVSQFMMARVAEDLAGLRKPVMLAPGRSGLDGIQAGADWELMHHDEVDEAAARDEIVSKVETQSNIPLFLLGQRLGVLAARSAFKPSENPFGPGRLTRHFMNGLDGFSFTAAQRRTALRLFERFVLSDYVVLTKGLNDAAAAAGMLPHLHYIPTVTKRTASRKPLPAMSHGPISLEQLGRGVRARSQGQGSSPIQMGLEMTAMVESNDLDRALTQLQGVPRTEPQDGAPGAAVERIKKDVQSKIRAMFPKQVAPVISDQDSDSLDIMGLFLTHMLELFANTQTTSKMIDALHVPLMRVAVKDKEFFITPQHPARRAFQSMIDTSAAWLDDDDVDPEVAAHVNMMVQSGISRFDGTPDNLVGISNNVTSYLASVAQRAAVAEKRCVEANKGKDKLARAQRDAQQIISEMLSARQGASRLTRAFLEHAWVDVLALAAVRQDDQPERFPHAIHVAQELLKRESGTQPASPTSDMLIADIGKGLAVVGYHSEEASGIAHRLVFPDSPANDGFSRTEITLRLKSRMRFGQQEDRSDVAAHQSVHEASARMGVMEELKKTELGTWFEFTSDKSAPVRRRLAWMSLITERAVFVNRRGQKVKDVSMHELVHDILNGSCRVLGLEIEKKSEAVYDSLINQLVDDATAEQAERKV